MKKKKQILFSAILLDIFLIGLGISYAFFTYSKNTNQMVYNFGDVYVKLVSDNSELYLSNMFPETYEEATSRTDNYIDFEVSSKNESSKKIVLDFSTMYIDTPAYFEDEDRLLDKYVRVQLIDITDSSNPDILIDGLTYENLNDFVIYTTKVNSKTLTEQTRTYRFRAWMDENVLISDTSSSKTLCASNVCDVLNDDDDTNDLSIIYNTFIGLYVKVEGYNAEETEVYLVNNEVKSSFAGTIKSGGTSLYSMSSYANSDIFTGNVIWPQDDYLLNGEPYIYNGTNIYDSSNPVNLVRNTNPFSKYIINLKKIFFNRATMTEINNRINDSNTLYSYKLAEELYLYIIEDTASSGYYDLYIVSPKTIVFPEDSSNMFAYSFNTLTTPCLYYGYNIYQDAVTALSLNTTNVTYEKYIEWITSANYSSFTIYKNYATNFMAHEDYTNLILPVLESGMNSYGTGINYNTQYYFGLNLEGIYFNNVDTSQVKDMSNMFMGNAVIKDLNLASFDTSNVTNMNGMFAGLAASSTTTLTIDLDNLDTSKVTDMGFMFSGIGSNVVLANIENLDTSKVTDMTAMFSGSLVTGSIDLSSWDVSNVTKISNYNMGAVTDLAIGNTTSSAPNSDYNLYNNIYFGQGLFSGSKYSSINLSGWNTKKLTNANDSFNTLTNLVTLNLSGWNNEVLEINKTHDFIRNVDNLKNLNLSGFFKADFGDLNYFFTDNYPSMENLDLSYCDFSTMSNIYLGYGDYSNSTSGMKDNFKLNLSHSNFGNVMDFVYEDGSTASFGIMKAANMSEIDLSYATYTYNNLPSFYDFALNKNLITKIDLTGFVAKNLNDLSNTFSNLTNLVTLILDDIDIGTSAISTFDYSFKNCSSLETIDLSSLNINTTVTLTNTFYGCSSLKTIYVNTFGTSTSTGTFSNCSTNLVGGNGTIWSSSNVDATYAVIDTSETAGYFTYKAN